jgi:hypothetical protein
MRSGLNIRMVVMLYIGCLMIACDNTPKEVTTDMINMPGGSTDAANLNLPEISFEEIEFDFGRVIEGERVKHTYEFENTGDGPLIISAIEPSCGCTVAKDWPKEPIPPGETGIINIEFDTHDKVGNNNKNIAVMTNTSPSRTYLYIKGEVIGPQK